MDSIRKESKKYIAEIKKNMLCPASKKKSMIKDFQNMVFDYIEENSVTDVGEVCQQFGAPKEIAKQLLCDMDPQHIKKIVNIRKVVIVSVVIALSMLLFTLITEMITDASPGYFVVELITDPTETKQVDLDSIQTAIP
ncbi:MAG: DUF6120 family protein [Oscillospiraceae bacterium]|nr:DUF6120 family protein [Oscillospiraceae bacterium]